MYSYHSANKARTQPVIAELVIAHVKILSFYICGFSSSSEREKRNKVNVILAMLLT